MLFYDLIMKNKELLLDRDPKKSPVRFIFSHSALREGWDNPNVFQICTLKQSSSEVRKRQEVGRGLRLCVNQDGERMDANVLGNDVQSINVLTVIASESYDSFAKGLQTELADAVAGRPVAVTADLFKGKVIVDARGNEQVVDGDIAQAIFEDLIANGYVKRGVLTDKYYADKANGAIQVAEEVADSRDSVINILDSVYDSRAMQPENARDKNVELQVDPDKLAMPEFKALWKRISPKSVYVVDFDTDELVKKAIASLNQNLHVPKIFFKVETGAMDEIKSRDSLLVGSAFSKSKSSTYDSSKQIRANSSVKYDLIGKLVGETGLTRKAVVAILTGIEKSVFEQFKFNPEEFIIKAAALINDEKATAIIQHMLNVAVSRAVHSLAVVTSQDPRNDQTNYGDLTRYIEYNNFEVIQSQVYSVFDMLYQGYAEQRRAYLQKHKRVSEYDSENLMYSVIQEVLSDEEFSSIGCAVHVSLATLVKDYEPLTEEENKYARNPLTHVDFLLFNQMDKQPMLAIEVDGTGFHEAGSKQAERDMKKNSILEKCGVPLLRLRTDGSGEKEKIKNALKGE